MKKEKKKKQMEMQQLVVESFATSFNLLMVR